MNITENIESDISVKFKRVALIQPSYQQSASDRFMEVNILASQCQALPGILDLCRI